MQLDTPRMNRMASAEGRTLVMLETGAMAWIL